MDLKVQQAVFEQTAKVYESTLVTFDGVEGWDVYNPSAPFEWEGERYIFGRVERRGQWARSWVGLFKQTGKDHFTRVPDFVLNPLEDPFVTFVNGELTLGGVHVRYTRNRIETFETCFFRGTELSDMRYFTTGPVGMKDIRLLGLQEGRIGVFTRPNSKAHLAATGRQVDIGFTVVDSLDELDANAVTQATPISGVLEEGQWGGCNKAYLLQDGFIGVIGHICYQTGSGDTEVRHYLNMSFVFRPEELHAQELQLIGTRKCYPQGPSKRPNLVDCCFPSGIILRDGGLADLYSGIGDCQVGRITIDNPFSGHGKIIGW